MAIILPKSIFYHIPKTGGSWVTKILKDIDVQLEDHRPRVVHRFNLRLEHVTPKDVMEEKKRGKLAFVFVRHPATWYQSLWKFRMYRKWDMRFILDRECRDDDFNRFVLNCISRFSKGFVSELFREFTGDNLELVDFIGKQENLAEDLQKVLRLAGEPFDDGIIQKIRERKPVNRSLTMRGYVKNLLRHKRIKKLNFQYHPDTLAKIKVVEKWAMEKFGYE